MAAEALQALNRILQYRQQREDTRVSQSLAFMELSERRKAREMQMRQQNIAVMSSNLDLMQKTNETMKIRSAENFLQQSGLSGIYAKYKDDDDGLTKAVDELSGKPGWIGEDDYSVEMSREIASDLVTATWSAYEQQNPNAIINIGSKLHFLDDPEAKVSPGSYEAKLFKSFSQLGYLKSGQDNSPVINTFKTMRSTLDNEMSIRKELEGFVKGDYKIDEDFTFVDESLNRLDMESIKRDISPRETQVTTVLPLDKQIEQFETLTVSHKEKIEKNEILLKNLDKLEKDILFYQENDPNYIISDKDKLQIENKTTTIDALTEEVEASIKAIEELKKSKEKFKQEKSSRAREQMKESWRVLWDFEGLVERAKQPF
jgi:hypothetical protein